MNSIKNRILLAVLLAVALPLVIIFLASQTVLQATFISIERSNLEDVSAEMSRNVALMMEGISSDLRALSTNPLLQPDGTNEDEVIREMKRQVGVHQRFADISIYNADALLVYSTDEELEPIYRDHSPIVENVLAGETVINKPSRKPGAEGLYVKVYLPLQAEDGPISGFIKARVAFDNVASYIADRVIGKYGQAILLDEWGNLIAHRMDDRLLTKATDPSTFAEWRYGGTGVYIDEQGAEQLYASISVDAGSTHVGGRWLLVCQKPMTEVEGPIRTARSLLAVVVSISGAFAVLISLLLARRISRPLIEASEVSNQVAAGDLGVAIDTRQGPSEIRLLAKSFNQMVDELRTHRADLERKVEERTASLLQSQNRLSQTMAQLRAAFDTTREGILLVDNSGVVVATNGQFCQLFGFEERQVIEAHVSDLQMGLAERCQDSREFQKAWTRALVDAEVELEFEYDIETPKPAVVALYSAPVFDNDGMVFGRLWAWRDMTEQRTLERGLRQSQKMEAIGQLAGGVAHDFNNLLTGIVGNLALVEMQLEGEEHRQSRSHLSMAMKAGDRAAELIKQLLGFSRRSHLKLVASQANDVVHEVRDLLTASIDPKFKIRVDTADSAWPVFIDPNQLEQVVMNMCVNAKDALGSGGGTITLSTHNEKVGSKQVTMHPDATTGEFLRVSVEDDGEGMSPEVQARIFEPFFTTKEQGKGTGLGLATSFGIIKQLGGWIVCDSRAGEGTRFDIYLPKSTMEIQLPEERRTDACISTDECKETLLLVDDELIVRSVAETLLTKLGYKILVAGDGEEALEVYAEHKDEIDLVMLDLTMPKLSGTDTFRLLRERYDYVPVLICSGYLVDLTAFEEEAGARPDGFVQKPYNMDTMARTVREVINQARKAA